MELFRLLGKIIVDNAEARKALQDVSNDGQQAESKLSKVFGVMGKAAAVAGKAIAKGLAVGATAMAGLTVKALQSAGDLEQNMGGAEAVFGELGKTIGDMKTPMQIFNAETGKVETQMTSLENVSKQAFQNMGLSQSNYLATANKMGALFKGAGFETQEALDMSSQAMQRAADVASIMGIDTEAAMEAVAGAAKGNFTMMDNLGVAMNDTAIGAYALEKGINKTTAEMSQQEKIGLAMEMFLDKTSYAAGNYAKENATLAGSLGTAKAAFSNFLAGSGDVDSLVSSFSNLANVVVKSISEIAPRLTKGLSDLVQQVVPLIPPLLNQLLPVLVEGATTLISGLVSAMPGIIQAIMNVLPALIDAVMQLITQLATALPQIIEPIVTALPQIIDTIVSALPTLIPALIDGLVQIIVMLCTSLPQIIQPIIDNLPMIVTTIVSALIENLPALILGLIQLVLGIVKALPQIFKTLYVELPAALFKGIFDGLVKVFSGLGSWFGKTFSGAKDAAVNAWKDTKEKWNNIKEKCVEGFNNLKDKISTKFNEAKESAQKKWSDAKEKWSNVKDKVVDGFSDLKDKLSPLFSKAKSNAVQTWSTVKSSFEKIKKGDVVGAFNDLGSMLKGKFSTALDSAKKGFDKIKQIGKDLISGLWKGINDKFSWLTGKIKGFAKSVTDKLKGFFGIKSPAKSTAEMGKYLAEGLAVGIDENTEKAESASEKMGKKILEAAQKRLEDYKVYNELTLEDEIAFWDSVRVQCAEGTDSRIAADKKYLEAKKALNDETLKAEEELQEELQKKLDEFNQKVIDRTNELVGSFGLFDSGKPEETELTTTDMMNNLSSQLNSMIFWEQEMGYLKSRIGEGALYEELKNMGVASLDQIRMLNKMSDYEIEQYRSLYDQRRKIAESIVAKEFHLDEPAIFGYDATSGKLNGGKSGSAGVSGIDDISEQNSGSVSILSKILQAIIALDDNMGGNLRDALENTALKIGEREFARIVKAVN